MKINILVIDDLPEERLVMESILAELGQNIIVASSGEEALMQEHAGRLAAAAHRQSSFLAETSATRARLLDGEATVRALSRRPVSFLADLRAVALPLALTGYGQPKARRRARESGFDVHRVKPIEPQALIDLQRRSASLERTSELATKLAR